MLPESPKRIEMFIWKQAFISRDDLKAFMQKGKNGSLVEILFIEIFLGCEQWFKE